MPNIFIPALVIFIAPIFSFGQEAVQLPTRYKNVVFEKVKTQKNLLYRDAVPDGMKKKYYQFDFYEPAADTVFARPLIIWLHGGGFKFGKKTSGGLPLWSKTFARRGYVCASINYRLSKKHPLKNFADLVSACADAVQDTEEAIRFFKLHAHEFRIDTSRIILGGNSAGGMIALQAAYSNPSTMRALPAKPPIAGKEQTYNPERIVAVINYWGALFDINSLKNARIPIVSVHGRKDRVVPVDNRTPSLFGSLAISRMAESLGIPNALKIYDGYAHELQKHFNPLFAGRPAHKRWLVAGDFTAAFLFQQLFLVK